jgi:hypothetical protein
MKEIDASELDRRIRIIETRSRDLRRKWNSIQSAIMSIFLIASIACLISAAHQPKSQDNSVNLNFNVRDHDGQLRSFLNFNPRNQYNRVRFNGSAGKIRAVFGVSYWAALLEMACDQSKKQFKLNLMSD